MEQEAREFEDWEMLQITDKGLLASASDEKSSGLDVLIGGSERVIKSDYFSVGSEGQYEKKAVEEEQEQFWFGSDDSSVIGPRLEPGSEVEAKGDLGFRGIETAGGSLGVSGSDLGKKGSVAMNLGEFEGKDELGHGVDVKNVVGFEGIEKIVDERDNPIEFWLDSGSKDGSTREFDEKTELVLGADAKREDSEGIGIESKNSGELILDSGGVELVSEKFEGTMGEDELDCGDLSKMGEKLESGGVMESGGGKGDGLDSAAFVEEGVEFPSVVESGGGSEVNLGDGEKKGVIWYKLPLELLKFCIFRTSPVWSVSIAAAVVGFVILRKRLYKMRRKSRSIPLKVSMDDKKVSQIMVRVARLNEAFSVVKRVPIIRSSLPGAGGVTPWPVMGLRPDALRCCSCCLQHQLGKIIGVVEKLSTRSETDTFGDPLQLTTPPTDTLYRIRFQRV